MTDPDVDIIGEIGELFDEVQLSPSFAAGVRARIDVGRGVRVPRLGWRAMAMVWVPLSLAAVVLAMLVVQRPASAPGVRSVARTEPSSATAPDQSLETPAPDPTRRARPTRAATSPVKLVADDVTTVSRLGSHDVIVPADQRVAMARLLAGVRSGQVMGPAGMTPPYDRDGLLLPLSPVIVAPLPALAPDDPDDSGNRNSGGSNTDRPRRDKS